MTAWDRDFLHADTRKLERLHWIESQYLDISRVFEVLWEEERKNHESRQPLCRLKQHEVPPLLSCFPRIFYDSTL